MAHIKHERTTEEMKEIEEEWLRDCRRGQCFRDEARQIYIDRRYDPQVTYSFIHNLILSFLVLELL